MANLTLSQVSGTLTGLRSKYQNLSLAGASPVPNEISADMYSFLNNVLSMIDPTPQTATQLTSTTTSVTLAAYNGVITTFTQTAATGVSVTFTVTNSLVVAGDNVRASVVDYAGTFSTDGIPVVSVDNIIDGAFNIVISNVHAANALSGVLKIGFKVN